ncbi:MAG: hypothetical protein ACI901_000794 [Octadecabacter sp.]
MKKEWGQTDCHALIKYLEKEHYHHDDNTETSLSVRFSKAALPSYWRQIKKYWQRQVHVKMQLCVFRGNNIASAF